MKKFETGSKYSFTFIGDSDLHICYKVINRTAKTVTVTDGRETKTCRINVYEDHEFVKPCGTYSMNPILSADKPTPDCDLGVYRTGMGV